RDNTLDTPAIQIPLLRGYDLLMNSTPKYLGGHSDALGGALVTREKDAFWQHIRQVQELSGAVLSPFDCYLTVRGIKTLPYRMRGHDENARRLVAFLESHPLVEAIYYPGYGGMLSFQVEGDEPRARKLAN